ncbi:MAG: HAD-IB family hydrolase [Treponema sp.]|nr:HAD-IB family hydrolase [Treponema sp.]
MTGHRKNTVHIFDIDHTVIRKSSAEYFVRVALKNKVIGLSQISRLPADWIKYKLAHPDMDFIENTVKKLSGIKKTDLDSIAEICFKKYIKPNIYKDAAIIIEGALKKNERVIFATSSFDFIVKPLEEYFNMEESLASVMEYKEGLTTGNLSGYSLFGSKKKTAVEAWMVKNNIPVQDTVFYSDSYTDIPLLEYCGNPVAVNPDRLLAREARKRNWNIILFKKVLGK